VRAVARQRRRYEPRIYDMTWRNAVLWGLVGGPLFFAYAAHRTGHADFTLFVFTLIFEAMLIPGLRYDFRGRIRRRTYRFFESLRRRDSNEKEE
jgi:hypothetical protein